MDSIDEELNAAFLEDLHKAGVYDLAAAIGFVSGDHLAGGAGPGDWDEHAGAGGGPLLPPPGVPLAAPAAGLPPASAHRGVANSVDGGSVLPPPAAAGGEFNDDVELATADGAVVACLRAAVEADLAVQLARARLAEHGVGAAQQGSAGHARQGQRQQQQQQAQGIKREDGTGTPPVAAQLGTQQPQQQQQQGMPWPGGAPRPRRGASAAAAAAAAAVKAECGGSGDDDEEPDHDAAAQLASPSSKRKRPPRAGTAAAALSPPTTPARQPNKGLRHFSLKVCEKVEGRGRTSYNQVADELVKDLTAEAAVAAAVGAGPSEAAASYDEKNIRRRVYDALNVLMAVGIIRKERKEIVWGGWPPGLPAGGQGPQPPQQQQPAQQQPAQQQQQQSRADAKLQAAAARVGEKAAHLEGLVTQLCSLAGLLLRNRTAPSTLYTAWQEAGLVAPNPLQLPFMLVQAPGVADVDVTVSADNRTAELNTHSWPFQIYDDESVLRMLRLAAPPEELLRQFGQAPGGLPGSAPSVPSAPSMGANVATTGAASGGHGRGHSSAAATHCLGPGGAGAAAAAAATAAAAAWQPNGWAGGGAAGRDELLLGVLGLPAESHPQLPLPLGLPGTLQGLALQSPVAPQRQQDPYHSGLGRPSYGGVM